MWHELGKQYIMPASFDNALNHVVSSKSLSVLWPVQHKALPQQSI